MKGDARNGRPSTARTDENVESVRRLLTEDRPTTLQMIADRLNIGKETVRRIVTEDLGHQTAECRVGGAKLSKTKETAISKIASEDNFNFFSTQKV